MSRPRNPAKRPVAAEWQITRITGKGARYLGQVEAPDAAAAIRRAIEKYEIAAEHQSPVAARPITSSVRVSPSQEKQT